MSMETSKFTIGGLSLDLIEDADNEFVFVPSSFQLPVDLVCGLSAASYEFPDQKQNILDALSPFQIASKLWSTSISCDVIDEIGNDQKLMVVFPGGWYGQQSALMCRRSHEYRSAMKCVIDKDKKSLDVFMKLIECDPYHKMFAPSYVCADFFADIDWNGQSEELKSKIVSMREGGNFVYVWNGIEHFDEDEVKDLIVNCPEATFVMQSTNMKHDDHSALCESLEYLCDYVPMDRDIMYKGELKCDLGSRFMIAF